MRTGKISMILKRKPEEKAGGDCPSTPYCPSLDCSHDELVAYIRSMKGGERVQEMGGSCMIGGKGTVEIRDGSVYIRWDLQEYAEGAGVMVTSFTGGARIIKDNAKSDAPT
jgi:hypothetical protein